MAQSNRFPAFITDEYQPGRGFADFERGAQESGTRAGRAAADGYRRQFETDMGQVKRIVEDALSVPRSKAGSLDLGVDQYRQAAAAAQAHAVALREVEQAALRAAKASGDTSEGTRRYLQAANAVAVEAEHVARAAANEATSMERLQRELDQTASKTTAVVASQRSMRGALDANGISARQSRFALVQLGQQLQDVTIQAQAGVDPFIILVQQGTQAAFAMSNFGGKIGRVASIIAGPFGTAAFIGVAALGAFLAKGKEVEENLDQLVQSADAFGNAQNALAQVMDLATGAFSDHNMELRETIRLQAMVAKQKAQDELDSARKALIRRTSTTEFISGSVLGREARPQPGGYVTPELRDLAQRFVTGELGTPTDKTGIVAARKELERLAEAGKTGNKTLLELQKTFLEFAVPSNTIVAQQAIIDALDGKGLDPRLRKTTKGRKPRDRSNSIANLQEFGNDALDRVDAIAGRFQDQPRIMEQARKAYAELDNVQRDLIRNNDRLIKESGKPIENFAEVMNAIAEARKTVSTGLIREIARPFETMPKALDKATDAFKALDDIAADLEQRRPEGFEKLLEQIAGAQRTIEEGLRQPYAEFVQQLQRESDIQELLIGQREEEAEILRMKFALMDQYGAKTEEELATMLRLAGVQGDITEHLRQQVGLIRSQQRAYEAMRAAIQPYLDAVEDLRRNIQQTIEGALHGRGIGGSVADFAKGILDNYKRVLSEVITERLFGNIFRDLRDMVEGRDPVKQAGKRMASEMDQAGNAAGTLASALESAAARIDGASPGMLAANDNGPGIIGRDRNLNAVLNPELVFMVESALNGASDNIAVAAEALGEAADELPIVINGIRPKEKVGPQGKPLTPQSFFEVAAERIVTSVAGEKVGKTVGKYVGVALQGAAEGQLAAGLILGKDANNTGAAIGGAIGKAAGTAIGTYFGGEIGGKIGGTIGSILGGTVGGMLGTAKYAAATINAAAGDLAISSVGGNSGKRRDISVDSASGVMANIERIAEALGADLTGSGSVSLGIYKDSYRVDPSGRGRVKVKNGAIDFGDDAEAAVKFATLDLIKDGILAGLKQGTLNLLRNAKDLDLALEKALKFESVFIRLKEHLDPVGAAIDELNKEFASLRKLFEEAGASAEEFAQLEQLYQLEREKALKESGERSVSALKDLLNELTVNNSALSLRERLQLAQAQYDPLAARVAAGETVDYDAFAEAARNMLEIQRQLFGSQEGYFTSLEEVIRLTNLAITQEEGRLDAGSEAVVGAIGSLQTDLNGQLQAVNDNLGVIIGLQGGAVKTTYPGYSEAQNF